MLAKQNALFLFLYHYFFMTKQFSIPRGTADIFPSEAGAWQEIEAKARRILADYNYQEIRTPIFEETGLFRRSLGQTSEVVAKQLLELSSSGKEGFSLRPEGTAPVVRAYVENSIDRQENLTKLFYMGPMFRGERPQKGRLRQFHQIGVEVIGPNTGNPYLDAEVIALNVNILKAFGLQGFRLKINTLGSCEDKENFSKGLRHKLAAQRSSLCEDCQKRLEYNVFRILDCKNKECRAVIEHLHADYEHLSQESRDYYGRVKEALNALDIAFDEVPYLVRGLDYYTHTVFEISGASLGSQDALSAGGRYNNLVSELGGPQADAIGFALGIERVLLAMPSEHKPAAPALAAYVIALDENVFPKAFHILNMLRGAGIPSDIDYKISSLKSQMRSAHKAGSRYAVILGEEENKRGVVALKDMATGNQREVGLTELREILKKGKV